MNLTEVNKFLSGRSGATGSLNNLIRQGDHPFKIPVIGENGAGVYLSQHTAFLEHKLLFGLYVRNTLERDTGLISGVKRTVKFVLGRGYKKAGDKYIQYPKANDQSKEVMFEVDSNHLGELAKVLDGESTGFGMDVRSGISIAFKAAGGSISIATNGSPLNINLTLSIEAIFEMKIAIMKYCKLLHPEINPETTYQALKCTLITSGQVPAQESPSAGQKERAITPKFSEALEFINDIHSLEAALAIQSDGPTTGKTKSCLWAIGHNTWNRGEQGLKIIQTIQNFAGEEFSRSIVDDANRSNFEILDAINNVIYKGQNA